MQLGHRTKNLFSNFEWTSFLLIICFIFSSYMVPGTYYDPIDKYVIGLRWFDRGMQVENGRLQATKPPENFFDLALENWKALAETGDCDAEFRYGLLFFLRKGTSIEAQNKEYTNKEAIRLWTIAANKGQPKAQSALGDLSYQNKDFVYIHCFENCGIERDLDRAYFWYKLSERSAVYQGEKEYIKMILPKIRSEMSEDQIKKVEELLLAWKPSPVACKPRSLL